jgi:hypothetical protein
MCGRITQKGGELPGLVTVSLIEEQFPPRWNGAPSQQFWVIRRHPETGELGERAGWWAQADQCASRERRLAALFSKRIRKAALPRARR